ncbi:MAG: family 1 glycosylhydrolase [Nitrospira sp.]|nr:family 1 glycosylhydrolase [Nitrospira sp.]
MKLSLIRTTAFFSLPLFTITYIGVAILGSMIVDFTNERTAAKYTPLTKFLDALLHDTKSKEMDRNDMNEKAIFITEDGCASDDVIGDNSKIYDTDRIMYLRNYLTQLQRAIADGVPVNGYFQWSAMDNFEWNAGFGNRLGLVHVNFKTQKRMPKASTSWFREAARRDAVV